LLPLVQRKSKSASAEAKRRDMENFFMANTKADAEGEKGFTTKESSHGKDRLQRIEEMVLEMDPDDEGGLVKKRGVLRWDKRKKKFIKDFDGNPMDKRGESKNRMNEAGRKIEKGYKTGLYERWKDKSKAQIQREGEDEDKSAYQALPDPRGRKYRHTAGTPGAVDANGRKVKDEIKTKSDIRKDREKRANLKEKNLPKAVRRLKEGKSKAANKPKPFGVKPHITKGSIRKMKTGSKKKK